MSKNIYNRGSEWRKWDLHIHTPLSINNQYGGNTNKIWEKFILSLENLPSDVKVLGINDYYFINGYEEVMKFKKNGRLKNIDKIFPVLEFRIDTFASATENKFSKINLHIFFDVDESNLKNEIKKIKEEFIGNIHLSKDHTTEKLTQDNLQKCSSNEKLKTGFSELIPNTEEVLTVINSPQWKDKTFLALGYTEWNDLEKSSQLKPKKTKMYSIANAFFTASETDNTTKKEEVLGFFTKKDIKRKALLHSGDIHDFKFLDTYVLDSKKKIKESKKYKCFTWIKADPTFEGLKQIIYEPIDRVKIQESKPEEKTGYQALNKVEINYLDIWNQSLELNPNLNSIIGGRSTGKSVLLAAIAKNLNIENPPKFNNEGYENFINSISKQLKVIWKDGREDPSREVEYFQQGYMYDLARNKTSLSSLVQNILRKKGKNEILDDYTSVTIDNKKKISRNIDDFFQILEKINLREKTIADNGDKGGVEKEILRLEFDLKKINKTKITEKETEEYEKSKKIIENGQEIKIKLSNDIQNIENLKKTTLLSENIEYELTSVSEKSKNIIIDLFTKLKDQFKTEWDKHIEELIKEIKKEKSKNDIKIKKALENKTYIKVLKIFNQSNHLKEIEEKIKKEKKKLFQITTLLEEIRKLKEQKEKLKNNIKGLHKNYVSKIDKIIPLLSDSVEGLEIKAKKVYEIDSYKNILKSALHGSHSKNQIYLTGINSAVQKISFEEEIFQIFDEITLNDLQLKGGYTSKTFADRLLSSNFYKIEYNLIYEKDDFEKMSDGKKSFVVLKLLLDFSDKDCPILIDQPEDDLDNRSIYVDLVAYLKKKKKIRQIVVATHNSNVVVSADSESVIVANQHGVKNKNNNNKKFQYISGSLENSFSFDSKIKETLDSKGIREHVCDILEGGQIAFENRKKKYDFKQL